MADSLPLDGLCPTCFRTARFPKMRLHQGRIAEQCVDPCHDEHVSSGGQGPLARDFLARAVKSWRGSTAKASMRLYGTKVPPLLPQPEYAP